jgi:nitrogen-specific signal transduction histidine kinase
MFAPELLAIQQQLENPVRLVTAPPPAGAMNPLPTIGQSHQLRAIFEHAPFGVIDIRRDGSITYGNSLAKFLLSQSNDLAFTQQNLFELLEAQKTDTQKLRWEIATDQLLSNSRLKITLRDRQGDHVSLSLTLIHYHATPDEDRHTAIFIEDLTGKAALASAVQHYTHELETLIHRKTRELKTMQAKLIMAEQNAAMVKTAGAVAHELRQPLTALMGTIELLQETSPPPSYKTQLATLMAQAERMAAIIRKMESVVEFRTRNYIGNTEILDLDLAADRTDNG